MVPGRRIRSGSVRRREARPDSWDPEWDRDRYNRLLAALVEDIELSEPRTRYATRDLVVNAR